MSQTFEKVTQDERKYGPSWSTHWFKIDVTIPDVMRGRTVVFQWNMNNEGMIWSTDGVPLQGLTGGGNNNDNNNNNNESFFFPSFCFN